MVAEGKCKQKFFMEVVIHDDDELQHKLIYNQW